MRAMLGLCGLLLLSGCQTSSELRTLAEKTSPFVAATHASVPAVERAYASQRARTEEEMALYAERKRAAQRESAATELLWSLSGSKVDKRSTEFLQRIRSADPVILAAAAVQPAAAGRAATPATPAEGAAQPATGGPAQTQRPSSKIGDIAKLTALLRDIHKGEFGGFDAASTFSQETWKQLKQLEKDANAETATTAPSGS